MSVKWLLYTNSSHKQKSYSTKFISGRQNDTVFLFIGLSTSIVFKLNKKKTFKLPSVMPQQTIPDHFGWWHTVILPGLVPPLHVTFIFFLFGQFLNDNSGYWIPPCRGVTSGVVGAGPHPHGHIHQPCFDTLAQPFNWRGKKKEEDSAN